MDKIFLLFLLLVAALIMTGLSVVSGGDAQMVGLAIFAWGVFIFLFYNTIVAGFQSEKRIKEYERIKPQLDKERYAMCIDKQRKNGLPTQEVLQEIADKFGFTLHGKMKIENGEYKMAEFKMETHKSVEQLYEMGINTYYDIFGDYFLFFNYSDNLLPTNKIYYDDHMNEKYCSDYNNMFFWFEYNPMYNANKDLDRADFIIQIVDDDGFFVYRKTGITKRESINDLTENEKQFILIGKKTEMNSHKAGVRRGCFYKKNIIKDGHVELFNGYMISPNKPLILN